MPKMGALNESRHISHHITLEVLQFYHAQVGLKSGEWVISNLRPSRGNAGNQSGFADIGKSHQANVGQELEFQTQVAPLTRKAVLKTPWSPIHRGGKLRISSA